MPSIRRHIRQLIYCSNPDQDGEERAMMLTAAKIDALWLDSPAKQAYYRLKGHTVRLGIVYDLYFFKIDGETHGVNATRNALLLLRKEHPKISKEEILKKVKEYDY